MEYLHFSGRNIDINLDLFKNLRELRCFDSNKITRIVNLPKLKLLSCGNLLNLESISIPGLESLGISNCLNVASISIPRLKKLEISKCPIIEGKLGSLFPELEYLDCSNSDIEQIPIIPTLKELLCYNTKVKEIPKQLVNLTKIYCRNTNVKIIDATKMPNLKGDGISANEGTQVIFLGRYGKYVEIMEDGYLTPLEESDDEFDGVPDASDSD